MATPLHRSRRAFHRRAHVGALLALFAVLALAVATFSDDPPTVTAPTRSDPPTGFPAAAPMHPDAPPPLCQRSSPTPDEATCYDGTTATSYTWADGAWVAGHPDERSVPAWAAPLFESFGGRRPLRCEPHGLERLRCRGPHGLNALYASDGERWAPIASVDEAEPYSVLAPAPHTLRAPAPSIEGGVMPVCRAVNTDRTQAICTDGWQTWAFELSGEHWVELDKYHSRIPAWAAELFVGPTPTFCAKLFARDFTGLSCEAANEPADFTTVYRAIDGHWVSQGPRHT